MREGSVILLVEDNEDDVILIRDALERAGVTNPVHVAGTASAAINYLSGKGEFNDRKLYPLPKVVFLDLKLPGESGHNVLEWMAKQEQLKSIVRVVLTGSIDPSDLKKSYELGANSYLQKPLTVEQLTDPSRNLRMLL